VITCAGYQTSICVGGAAFALVTRSARWERWRAQAVSASGRVNGYVWAAVSGQDLQRRLRLLIGADAGDSQQNVYLRKHG